jgi:predicted RND superfamily exporter protein
MLRFASWLAAKPWVVLAVALLLTLGLGFYAWQIRIESSFESVLPRRDPDVAYYEQIRQTFGSDDVAVVGLRTDDLFAPATLEKVHRVTVALEKLDGVEGVISLTNSPDIAANVFPRPPRLLPRIPPTPEDVAALKARLVAVPFYRQNLVAEDWHGTAINVFLKPLSDAEYDALRIDERVAAILDAERTPTDRFYFTGGSHVTRAAVAMMRADVLRFTPIAILLVLVTLWISFRTKRGVLLPFLAVAMALVWTLGIMVLTGHAITLGTFVLPPLLVIVGSSYAIHVMARYYEQTETRSDRTEVIVRAFERVWVPLLISALVTVIGFGSLMVSRIPAIFELGAFAVVGVLCLTASTLLALPAALGLMPVERVAHRAKGGTPLLDRLLGALAWAAAWAPRRILVLALVLLVVSLWGLRQIQVDADFLYFFSPRAPVRTDNETINQQIVGTNPFYIIVEGEPDTLKRWEVLKLVKDLEAYIETLPGITSTVSVVDILELLESGTTLNKASGGELVVTEQGELVEPEPPKPFWEEPRNLEPVLGTIAMFPDTFSSAVTKDFSRASIVVRTRLSGSRTVEETLEKIRAYIKTHFPLNLPTRLTGTLVLLTGTTSDIVKGQIESLSIALGVIFLVMSAMFLSFRIGLLAILPNLLPIFIFFGVMGWLGIRLNLGTSLIAAIALGIAVDSTVHYMARLNLELEGESDQEAAISRAVRTVGIPIVYTTVALFLGFLTFAFSSFVPIQNFGILSAVTMFMSLLANLVLLPTMLGTTKIITLWDLVGLRLGDDPTRTIPLFAGLRPSQARVVVLMGEVRRFKPGETIVRQGDTGNEMYVIIDGRTEVWASDLVGHRRRVAEHKRGDVFGEMALVRRGVRRTADVVAATDVEVLAVDQRFLQRVQRRYPRIASKVFLNLTGVLSDRLERTTQHAVAATA